MPAPQSGMNGEEIRGTTIAAGIWLTAGIGIAARLGREASAILGALLAFLIPSSLAGFSDFFQQTKTKG